MVAKHSQAGRRGSRSPSGSRVWWFLASFLFVLAICAVLFSVARRFPLETLIFATVIAIAVAGVILYIWELTIIGWVVDFLSEIGMPKFQARQVALEFEQVGEIIVVTLRDNIATLRDCHSVQKQLTDLIDEHHCDFVLDFLNAGRISTKFREVMISLMKAARREAEKLGKPDRPVPLPHGEVFRLFDDRAQAVEEMFKHGGHGWVVLCSVPVGTRAVFG